MTTLRDAPESTLDLWLLIAGPVVWAAHLLASYATAAVWCAKAAGADGSLGQAQLAIAAYTVVALALLAWIARRGWKRHGGAGTIVPHDRDSPEDRTRFLGFTTFLLAAISVVAVLYAALAAVLAGSCR
jgi:hypothetical protein